MKLNLILLLFIFSEILLAQTIFPPTTNEYCPLQNYSFNGTVPECIISSPSTTNGITIVSFSGIGTKSFSMTLQFSDLNIDQSVIIPLGKTNSNGDCEFDNSNKTQEFKFTRIKSLFFGTCNFTWDPTPLCPTLNTDGNINFSFPALRFSNITSGQCFGTITLYDYLVPAGWKVNGVLSNGVNRITAANQITITFDNCSGHNSSMKVRALNQCNPSGLHISQELSVPITRCINQMSILGEQAPCRGSHDYIVQNLHPGSTVNWSVNLNDIVTLTQNNHVATLSVTKPGFIILTATISLPCNFGNITVTKNINVGDQFVGLYLEGWDCIDQVHLPFLAAKSNPCYECRYDWLIQNNHTGNATSSVCSLSYINRDMARVYGTASGKPCAWAGYSVGCVVTNNCSGERRTVWHPVKVTRRGCCVPEGLTNPNVFTENELSFRLEGSNQEEKSEFVDYYLYPNPTNNDIVTVTGTADNLIEYISITDPIGNKIKEIKFSGHNYSEKIDVSDLNAGLFLVQINHNRVISLITSK